MGDSEFVGGGSVKWKVRHSKGDNGNGNKHGGNGKDKDPTEPGAMFTVSITGHGDIEVPVDGTTIRINWPGSAAPAMMTAGPMTTARKRTTAKKRPTAKKTKKAKSAKKK